MVARDAYMGEVFKRPPITAYRRQANLRNYLVRAKVPNIRREKRILKGMAKCDKGCVACPFIKECKSIKINQKEWKISRKFNCNTFNVVYAITCQKDNCRKAYIGETQTIVDMLETIG